MEQHEKNEDIPKRLRLMKKRLKQVFALVSILIVTLSLSGCEKFVETDVSAETKSTIQTISETSASDNQEETQFVTEAKIEESTTQNKSEFHYVTDWSIDELVQNIEMNGVSYSMPFTVEDLGEKYYINNRFSINEGDFDLYYNNEYYALISIHSQNDVYYITFADNSNFKLGEFYCGNSKENMVKTYGCPSIKNNSDSINTYLFKNNKCISVFYKDQKIESISIKINDLGE